MIDNNKYTLIDLFSGAGGMTEGFRNAGFQPIFAVECDDSAADTYEANFGAHVFRGNIEDLPINKVPKADIIIGGPPCQGFSPLGKMSSGLERQRKHTDLNGLLYYFFRVLEFIRPKGFVIENVPEILKSEEFVILKEKVEELGYKLDFGVLNAFDFGVAQLRKRAIIMGLKAGTPKLPEPTGERKTVRDAIAQLPLIPDGLNWHIGRNPTQKSIERYKCIPPGGNRFDLIKSRPDLAPPCWLKKKTGSTDVFGRLQWDKPALTIRTEFFKPEKGRYLHPEADRPLTHRESALIQSFRKDFVFKGSKTDVARQIGNAVPPKLAEAIAIKLMDLLKNLPEDKCDEESSRRSNDYFNYIDEGVNVV